MTTVAITPRIDSWTPIDLNTLPDTPPVQPTLGTVGNIGLVYPGKRHVFSGPQESAKTLAAYLIGIQVIRQGGTLLLIDFEMGAYDARNRLHDLGATPDDLSNLLYLEPDEPATHERLHALAERRPDLVVIDAAAGAYDLQGLDDNKRQDVERLSRLYVDRFWRANIATIILDHVVKNNETRGKYAIGSERKVGGADVHLGFEVITPISRGHTGLYKIVTHKDRGGYLKRGTLAELELASDPDTHRISWQLRPVEDRADGQEWMPTKVMQKNSETLARRGEPVSRKQMIEEIGGRHDIARKAIDHLVRLEYVTETAGPHGAKLIETSRSFTVLEWENQPDPTTSSHLVPPSPGLGLTTSSHLVPPLRGDGTGWPTPDELTSSRSDWLDTLAPPTENGGHPTDLFTDPDDDLPL